MSRRVAGVARGGQRSAEEIIKKAKAADKISSYFQVAGFDRSMVY